MKHRLLIVILCTLCWCWPNLRAIAQIDVKRNPATVDYSRDILPIFAAKCFVCHGPDAKARKAGIRLDLREAATRPARSGDTPIKPGDATASEVVRRIFAQDASEQMPPVKGGKPLTENEKDLVKSWIEQGAPYKLHWAFVKPQRPSLPEVTNKAWTKNAIDTFVLARLEKEGLKPSPPADRATLIRRLSLDLRGLPPTLQEIDEFLADSSAKAYEKLVDRMLASPRYGEKMAERWLDLARFGDTSGFHFDSTRQMWLWRDWVIAAFNKNMPFDQFTIEQLAGDLLPAATVEQKIASGFNRNTRFNEEGGVDPEEYVVYYTMDRTNTLGQVWLGLTLGCAQCHSHKYDPISQKEYYQLYAYFAGISEPMKSGNHGQPLPPILKLPTPEQTRALAVDQAQQDIIEKAIAKELQRCVYTDPLAGTLAKAGEPIASPQDVVWVDDEPPFGAKLQGLWTWGEAPRFPVFRGKKSMHRADEDLHQHYFVAAGNPLPISAGDWLFTYVWLDPKNPPKSVMLQWNDGTWDHRAYWGADKCFLEGAANGPDHFYAGALPEPGQWVRLEIDAVKVGLGPGALVNGMAFGQYGGSAYYDSAGVSTLFPHHAGYGRSQTAWENKERNNAKLPAEVQEALKTSKGKRSAEQDKTLRDYYLRKIYEETREIFVPLEEDLAQVAQKIQKTEDAIPHTLITQEMPQPRPAHVLLRGDFLHKGEKVGRAVPAIFPPLPQGQPNNRLGLARWLVSPEHPLTARVAVNRLWGQMFGNGIVRSVGDFGSQGDYPSHPELLDWLAVEFMAKGWDVKAVLRTIALSATYQQSSAFPRSASIDPANRLLARAPRYRLSAEELRDSALAISGLLSGKIGGPSFMPYQPSDFYKGKNEDWPWKASEGADQYRRGIYAFWRRNSLHPMFAIFDAPTREECSVFRPRTNTPLQALVTLNDPTFVEAARVFAQKILTHGPRDLDSRLRFAFRSATCRLPDEVELKVLRQRYKQQLERFRADPEAASKFVNVGQYPRDAALDVVEHAAWTAVANMLLNLDEVLTRE